MLFSYRKTTTFADDNNKKRITNYTNDKILKYKNLNIHMAIKSTEREAYNNLSMLIYRLRNKEHIEINLIQFTSI